MILEKAPAIPAEVTAGLNTVAVRFPVHPVARALIDAAGRPLAAPSANLSGRPSTTTAEHVLHDLQGRIPLILDGGPCQVGLESTVVDLSRGPAVLLRPGGVTREMLEAALGEPVALGKGVMEPLPEGEKALSPGLKHRHYAPRAQVVVVLGGDAGPRRLCPRPRPGGCAPLRALPGEEPRPVRGGARAVGGQHARRTTPTTSLPPCAPRTRRAIPASTPRGWTLPAWALRS